MYKAMANSHEARCLKARAKCHEAKAKRHKTKTKSHEPRQTRGRKRKTGIGQLFVAEIHVHSIEKFDATSEVAAVTYHLPRLATPMLTTEQKYFFRMSTV